MPRLPTVAIIGRPNTGKSTLFNSMVGDRRAIISDVPGTTRDHVASRVETDELDYLLLDTGGMGGGTEDEDFEDDVHAQSLLALGSADLILFTVNSREELTKNDREIVSLLRKNRKQHVPVIMVATKCDNEKIFEEVLPELESLSIADAIVPVSALNNLGTVELMGLITEHLHKLHFTKEATSNELQATSSPRIAIVGKPNVGKSSIVNALMSEPQRKLSPRLVSDVPGTTRDAADVIIKHDGQEFIFIDTAGLRRQSKVEEHNIESFAVVRSIQAIEAADIVVLVLDAHEPISKQDQRIAALAIERGASLMIVLNKNDLITAEQREEKMKEIALEFPFCRFAPVLPVSAKTREGLLKIFDRLKMIAENRVRRIATKDLHTWFKDAVGNQPMGALGKAKHITQAEGVPPTFVVFVRNPKEVNFSQLRFLDNRLREMFDYTGTPIRWVTKRGQGHERQ